MSMIHAEHEHAIANQAILYLKNLAIVIQRDGGTLADFIKHIEVIQKDREGASK